MTPPRITVDACDKRLEVTVYDGGVGLSVVVSAADWVAITAQAEQLAPMVEYRLRAREAASHGARRG